MTISFETTTAPTPGTSKDVKDNPYWPAIEHLMKVEKNSTETPAVRFDVPVEDGDDYKKATGRVRSKLNEVSDHIGRTIRLTCKQEGDAVKGTVWLLDRKITKTKKDQTPAPDAAEVTATPASAPEFTAPDSVDTVETPETSEAGKGTRRGGRRAA